MSDPLHALQQAIAAIKAGDKAAGRRLLAEVIRGDPRNEAAWLWMSAATDSDEQRRACLERVLAINPGNPTARRGLARLGPTFGGTRPASQPPGQPAPPEVGHALPSVGHVTPPARRASPLAGHAHRTKAVLPWWSLLVAFGAAIVVYATVGITTYLAFISAVGFLRGHLKFAFPEQESTKDTKEH